jgi:CheY-like chemotaxis protein
MKRRVLVVEDDVLIGMMVADMLEELGYEPVGPVRSLDEGVAQAETETPLHAAILDVNLDGVRSYPIAEALDARAIPYVFATGYGSGGLDGWSGDATVLTKPFDPCALRTALDRLVS